MAHAGLDALDHERWMREALALAAEAGALGEIPVGALVLHHPPGIAPRVIGRGFNQRERDADPAAHAEIVALRAAGKALGYWRMVDCTLYVTLEPCPMCAGAMVQSRLTRVVYGCRDPKAGAVDSLFQLCGDERLNHQVQVVSAVMAEQAAALLKDFFTARRKRAPHRTHSISAGPSPVPTEGRSPAQAAQNPTKTQF